MKSDFLTVARKEIIDIFSHRLNTALILGVSFYIGVIGPFPFLESQRMQLGSLQSVFDIYLSFIFLASALTISWGLTSITFITEKIYRTLETLLTTPLSLNDIWLGKTLAIFALCYVPTLAYSLGFIVYMNLAVGTGEFVIPSISGWLIMLLLAPLLICALIALQGLIQMLIMQPQVGQFATLAIVFFIYREGIHFSSAPGAGIVWAYCIALFASVLLMVLALRLLSKERIILSIG